MKRHIDRPPSRPRSCSGCRPGPGSRTAQLSTRATDVAIRAQGRRTLLFVEAARTGDVDDFVDATGAAWAWQLGASLLAKVLPRRWDHSTGSPAGRASVHRSLSHLGSSWLRMSNTSRSISSVGGTPTRAELTRYRPPGRRARHLRLTAPDPPPGAAARSTRPARSRRRRRAGARRRQPRRLDRAGVALVG